MPESKDPENDNRPNAASKHFRENRYRNLQSALIAAINFYAASALLAC